MKTYVYMIYNKKRNLWYKPNYFPPNCWHKIGKIYTNKPNLEHLRDCRKEPKQNLEIISFELNLNIKF